MHTLESIAQYKDKVLGFPTIITLFNNDIFMLGFVLSANLITGILKMTIVKAASEQSAYSQIFRPITTARLQVVAEKSGMYSWGDNKFIDFFGTHGCALDLLVKAVVELEEVRQAMVQQFDGCRDTTERL